MYAPTSTSPPVPAVMAALPASLASIPGGVDNASHEMTPCTSRTRQPNSSRNRNVGSEGPPSLTSERFQQARRIFERALDSTDEPAARRAFVAGACGADEELRREVESLLDAYERGSGFSMDTPLMDGAGAPKGQPGERSSVRVKLCGRCQSRYISGESLCPNDGEVLVYDPEALVGVTLDGIYRIEQLLGRGAMGMVYLARHTLLRDNVAIKVMPAELTADPDFLRRFLREGRAARAIHHPNAVTVHDLRMSSDGIAYMVMEYVEGTTLRG
jgi:hypothetical protein